jgi:hypothetical protein
MKTNPNESEGLATAEDNLYVPEFGDDLVIGVFIPPNKVIAICGKSDGENYAESMADARRIARLWNEQENK